MLITGDNNIRLGREEIFGPVITMIPFDDEEEGIAIANDSEFGLDDYVFSKDGAGRCGRPSGSRPPMSDQHGPAQSRCPLGGFNKRGVGPTAATTGCWLTPSHRPSS